MWGCVPELWTSFQYLAVILYYIQNSTKPIITQNFIMHSYPVAFACFLGLPYPLPLTEYPIFTTEWISSLFQNVIFNTVTFSDQKNPELLQTCVQSLLHYPESCWMLWMKVMFWNVLVVADSRKKFTTAYLFVRPGFSLLTILWCIASSLCICTQKFSDLNMVCKS